LSQNVTQIFTALNTIVTTDILPVIIAALLLWLSGLSVVFYRIYRQFNTLANVGKGGNLLQTLDKILKQQNLNVKELGELDKEIKRLDREAGFYVQKIGLIRFNPFNETGGDQSFSLALLDRVNTGFVMTGLHTRDRTRVYVKPVVRGKSRLGLSKDEEKAIKKAKS